MRFNETEFSTPAQLDFMPRAQREQLSHIIVACVVAFLVVVLAGLLAKGIFSVLVAGVSVALLGFFVIYRLQQNIDLTMATEYQNMLFAQAAALGASFALFVKRDGTVVYANDGMQKLFPRMGWGDARALEGIFESSGVPQADRERIQSAISAEERARIIFPLRVPTGETKDFILTVEPLERPAGFLLVRGREYRDQRSGPQLLPEMLRHTSADKIDHLLATTGVGHYVTDAFGRFEYVNPALEQALGYAPGDMLNERLGLAQMIYQLGNQPMSDDYTLADYAGTAQVTRSQGDQATVLLHQRLIRDARGKAVGVTGSVLPRAGGTA